MVRPFTYAAVDDRKDALESIARLMENRPDFLQIGLFTQPWEALEAIASERPELVFVDVEMAGLDGLSLLERIRREGLQQPVSVLVTGSPHYAVSAFHHGARGYLLKPVAPDRLFRTLDDLTPLLDAVRHEGRLPHALAFKDGFAQRMIPPESIVAIRAAGNFAEVAVDTPSTMLVSESLQSLGERLLPFGFVRIHRSTIVNLAHVVRIDAGHATMSDGSREQVGRTYQARFRAIIHRNMASGRDGGGLA